MIRHPLISAIGSYAAECDDGKRIVAIFEFIGRALREISAGIRSRALGLYLFESERNSTSRWRVRSSVSLKNK